MRVDVKCTERWQWIKGLCHWINIALRKVRVNTNLVLACCSQFAPHSEVDVPSPIGPKRNPVLNFLIWRCLVEPFSDASAISSISLSRAASKNAEYILRKGIRGRCVDADGWSFEDKVWTEPGVSPCDIQVGQGFRWDAQAGEHGYKSAGLNEDVSEAKEGNFSLGSCYRQTLWQRTQSRKTKYSL